MTWPRAFLAVPPRALTIDPTVARESPKASPAEISRWMGNVPKIYSMIEHGTADAEFHRMANAPTSGQERELGETYRNLFSTSASAQPIRAELGPDGALTAVAGQHRARSAQELGVLLIPVHVSAPDQSTLDIIRADLERQARAINPSAVETHRVYDEHLRDSGRERPPTSEQPDGPDRSDEPQRARER